MYARKTRQILYILFVDYKKAYDKVNRSKLLSMLSEAGCGSKFLKAICESLKKTVNVLRDEKFDSCEGVRQGGTISCSLFTFYINRTIQAVKQYGTDGYLQTLHTLLVMDDTLLLATSREAMQRKFELLADSAHSLDMELHPVKSKFIVVNANDFEPFQHGDISVAHIDQYMYVGTPVSNAPIKQQIEAHIEDKHKHVSKFSSFLAKNGDAPFQVKVLTWNACMSSSLLYGCESWLTKDLRCIEQPLLRSLKELLSVRSQTCTDLIYLELGQAGAKAMILDRQQKFLKKIHQRPNYQGSILQKTIALAISSRSPMGLCIKSLEDMMHVNHVDVDIQNRQQTVTESDSSRRVNYCTLNPGLDKHEAYTNPEVPEYARISFSRLRLSSHKLKIETGRWSRTPKELRLCDCGQVQTEEHVLLECPLTAQERMIHSCLKFDSVENLMQSKPVKDLVVYCHSVLIKFTD